MAVARFLLIGSGASARAREPQMLSTSPLPSSSRPDDGLFRTRLAGRHARTSEAFNVLRADAPRRELLPGDGAPVYGGILPVSGDATEGYWELVSIRDEVFLSISNCHYTRERVENVLPEDFVEFHFMLAGPVSVDFSEAGQIRIVAPNLTVVHQGADMQCRVACGPGVWRSVGLHVPRAWFNRFLTGAVAEGVAARTVDEVASDRIVCHQMAVNVAALDAVEKLLDNPYQGARRLLYAQAKANELLCATVDLWQGFVEEPGSFEVFSARDLRLIEKARDLIVADLSRVPTIPELARAVGTNTSKLKRGFKFLYGMTVFEFGYRQRMHQALALLANERLSIQEVALATGYQHQTSFTTSFKECFGVSPKEVRRMPGVERLRARFGTEGTR